ncbi:MAG TPA: hypothetical protein VM536_19605 [Chloroflexia bacterium]|nr:hypothetical protein [Chloroflexia bacterium]
MTTLVASEPRPAAAGPAAPPRSGEGPPRRVLALFLVLLVATDFSGLLHIYGLGWLYSENLFLGLGWTMVLIAGLLLGKPRLRPLQAPGALALLATGATAALAAGYLLRALSQPPGWVAQDPTRDTSPGGLLSLAALQVAAVAAVPLAAIGIAYARREGLRRLALGTAAALLWLLSLITLLYDAHVGARAPDTWAVVIGAGVPTVLLGAGLLAGAVGLARMSPTRFLAAAIGAGLALRLLGLLLIPLTIRLGDMLPLIGMATDRLLQGQDPYIIYQMPWELPLTYWPLTVLSYIPAALAGVDARLINLLVGPAIGALLLWAGGRQGPCWAAPAFGLLYLTPTMFQWDLSTAAPPYWGWIAVAFALTVVSARRRANWWPPGAGVGAAMAAAPLALPFLPALGILWLQNGRRPALRRVLAAGAVLALIVGPFVLWDPAGFWNGAVGWFNDLDQLPLLKWQTDRSWAFEIGLTGPLWQAGLQGWLKPVQVILLGSIFLLGSWQRAVRTPEAALRWGAASYLLFMVTNPVIWPYLYMPALLAVVFALLPPPRCPRGLKAVAGPRGCGRAPAPGYSSSRTPPATR